MSETPESKIITPSSGSGAPEAVKEQDAPVETRLSHQTVNTLAGAVAQLVDIESRVIKQPNDDKLAKELKVFIANTMIKHSQEFIGCWFTVRVEYEPLCQTIAHVLGHVDAIRQQRYKQQRALEAQISEAAAKLKADQETPKNA